MGVVEKLKSTLLGSEERMYGYVCQECKQEFESPEHNPNFTECPQCGSSRTHSAV